MAMKRRAAGVLVCVAILPFMGQRRRAKILELLAFFRTAPTVAATNRRRRAGLWPGGKPPVVV